MEKIITSMKSLGFTITTDEAQKILDDVENIPKSTEIDRAKFDSLMVPIMRDIVIST